VADDKKQADTPKAAGIAEQFFPGKRSIDDDDFERTKESPVDFLRLRVLELAPQLGVDGREALEMFGIFVTAFGESWLNEAADDHSYSDAIAFRRSHLGDIVSTAGATQISELFEIADYLRAMAGSTKLTALITGLKEQFHQTILQLAFAARLRHIGATGVDVEPPTGEGRFADVSAIYGALRLRMECYRPTFKREMETGEAFRLATSVMRAQRESSIVLSVGIALKKPLNAALRKEVTAVARKLASEVIAASATTPDFPAFTAASDDCVISICRGLPTQPGSRPKVLVAPAFPHQQQNFDMFVRQNVAQVSTVAGLRGDPEAGVSLHHVAVWFSEESRKRRSLEQDLTKPLEKLGDKIEKKLAQARSETGDARIFVVDTWMTNQLHRVDQSIVERLRRKIVEAHANVAALLLVSRTWHQRLGRHGYEFYPLYPSAPNATVEQMVARLSAIDGQKTG
jgi:hypothetical protein